MELQFTGVIERFMDDQRVLTHDSVCLEPEQAFLERVCVGADSLPPVLELLEIGRAIVGAGPFRGDLDGRLGVWPLVVVLHVSEEQVAERNGHVLRAHGLSRCG